jgi:hypothetical protein
MSGGKGKGGKERKRKSEYKDEEGQEGMEEGRTVKRESEGRKSPMTHTQALSKTQHNLPNNTTSKWPGCLDSISNAPNAVSTNWT